MPNSITHLTFGHWFNQNVDILPNDLEELTLGIMCKQKVYNLPLNIKIVRTHSSNRELLKIPFGCNIELYTDNLENWSNFYRYMIGALNDKTI